MKFKPVTKEIIIELSQNLREEDRTEVFLSHGLDISQALWESVQRSDEVQVAYEGDKLLGVTGIAPFSILKWGACPWLVSTGIYPKPLLRHTKKFIHRWLNEYEYLINYVDADYKAALRWAKWAGFTVHPAERFGPFQHPFCKIDMRR